MRTIRFRGKDRFGAGWVYGYLVKEACGDVWIFPHDDTHCNAGGDWYNNKEPGFCVVDPETVGQFTGLKDRNGVEIYEGDILASGKARHLVEYQEKEGAFMGVNPNYGKDMLSGEDFSTPLHQGWITRFEKEVIGNIHDNPELLK